MVLIGQCLDRHPEIPFHAVGKNNPCSASVPNPKFAAFCVAVELGFDVGVWQLRRERYPRAGSDLYRRARDGSNLRPELSGLHAGLFAFGRLYQLQIHLDGPVQCHGLGPGRAMLRQSIFCSTWAASAAALMTQPKAATKSRLRQKVFATAPSTGEMDQQASALSSPVGASRDTRPKNGTSPCGR
jgi:hypothetical protein